MSRIFVKGLSKNVTEKELRDVFSQKGEVTDVRIMRTKTNLSRGFGFIGFRHPLEAQTAITYFNNTYMQTCKISVELATKYTNGNDDQDVKKKKNDKNIKTTEKEKEVKAKKAKDDKLVPENIPSKSTKTSKSKDFTDFMEVMKSRRQSKISSNEDGYGRPGATATTQQESEYTSNDEESDMEDINILPSLTATASSTDIDYDDEPDMSTSTIPASAKQKKLSDMDFLKSKITLKFSDETPEEKVDEKPVGAIGMKRSAQRDGDASGQAMEVDHQPIEHEDYHEKEIDDTGRLFVRNLQYAVTEDELRELFSSYGQISEVHIPLDGDKKGKGFAFVQFLFPEHALKAMNDLDGSSFQGRLLHIIPAECPREVSKDDSDKQRKSNQHLSSYQQKKEEERKKNINKKDGWNSSYVRSDAVVESLAER
jgi:multiple RNA-binding domain-containing protein 1